MLYSIVYLSATICEIGGLFINNSSGGSHAAGCRAWELGLL
jgi:hypothetical protein